MNASKTAFLFPGQGRLPKNLPAEAERMEQLLEHALEHGLPIRSLIAEQDPDRPPQTEIAQPILLIDSLFREQALREAGWMPQIAAGHSLGEYAALVCTGSLRAEDALRVVIERGRLMGGVTGGMTAILKLEIDIVRTLCAAVGDGVCIANHNAPTQVVVSGDLEALENLASRATDAGGRAIPLRVSGPFHSPRMLAAQQALEPVLRALSLTTPGFPIVSGVSGTLETDPEHILGLLCGQITAAVRWVDVVKRLEVEGTTQAIEVGSGDVLSRLGRQTSSTIRFMTYEEAIDEGS